MALYWSHQWWSTYMQVSGPAARYGLGPLHLEIGEGGWAHERIDSTRLDSTRFGSRHRRHRNRFITFLIIFYLSIECNRLQTGAKGKKNFVCVPIIRAHLNFVRYTYSNLVVIENGKPIWLCLVPWISSNWQGVGAFDQWRQRHHHHQHRTPRKNSREYTYNTAKWLHFTTHQSAKLIRIISVLY